MFKKDDEVKLKASNYYGTVLEAIVNKRRGGYDRFYRVSWRYCGPLTQYDTAPNAIEDLHFANEIELVNV